MFSGSFLGWFWNAFCDTFWTIFGMLLWSPTGTLYGHISGHFFGNFFLHLFWHFFDTYFDTCINNYLKNDMDDIWTIFWMILGTIFEWFLGDICCCSVTNRYLPPFYHLSWKFHKRTLEKLAQEVRICQMDMAMVSSLILRFQQRLLRTELHFWGFKIELIFYIENQILVIGNVETCFQIKVSQNRLDFVGWLLSFNSNHVPSS